MTERDVHALRAQALARLAEATRAANDAPDVEGALRYLTAATQEVLGDKEAHRRPGGLRAGERQFVVSCIFLVTADRQHNLLVAEHGFPPEQHRLRIPFDLGHPGWVAQHQRPALPHQLDAIGRAAPLVVALDHRDLDAQQPPLASLAVK